MHKRPNILVILSDQLRRDALGCYGNPDVRTPHIDRLAAAGVRFDRACSTYPICVPFRFTLMTGETAHSRLIPGIEYRMSPAEYTLADAFNAADCHTVYVGKWHLYGDHTVDWVESNRKSALTPVPRSHQGRWQKWLGFELCNDPFNTFYFEDADPTPKRIEGFQTDGLFDLAMSHLRTGWKRSQPFCCVLSVEPPHFPLDAPAEDLERWRGRPLSVAPSFGKRVEDPLYPHGQEFTPEKRERTLEQRRVYNAMVENLDRNVGRMLDFLRQERLDEDTVIVLVADHGDHGGDHGLDIRGKMWPYDSSCAIPLIVVDPRSPQRGGATSVEPVNAEDLFPTLLGLAGLHPPGPRPGMDLAPILSGAAGQLPRDGILLEYDHDHMPGWPWFEQQWRAFVSRRYKYVVLGPPSGAKPWMLFDLDNDPGEMCNLLHDPACREIAAGHHALLRRELVRTEDHFVLLPSFDSEGLNVWTDAVIRAVPGVRPGTKQER